jgi:hypothetical protein
VNVRHRQDYTHMHINMGRYNLMEWCWYGLYSGIRLCFKSWWQQTTTVKRNATNNYLLLSCVDEPVLLIGRTLWQHFCVRGFLLVIELQPLSIFCLKFIATDTNFSIIHIGECILDDKFQRGARGLGRNFNRIMIPRWTFCSVFQTRGVETYAFKEGKL